MPRGRVGRRNTRTTIWLIQCRLVNTTEEVAPHVLLTIGRQKCLIVTDEHTHTGGCAAEICQRGSSASVDSMESDDAMSLDVGVGQGEPIQRSRCI